MEWGGVIAAVIGAVAVVYLGLTFGVIPKAFDKRMRALLADYRQWSDRDNRHVRRLNQIAVKEADLPHSEQPSLDRLRLQRARLKIEIDQLEDRGAFLGAADTALEQDKYSQLDALDRQIDEHPERTAELEETRSRLVVRVEEMQQDE